MRHRDFRWLYTTLAGLLLVATLAAVAGSFGWFLELFAHFRVQYAVAALVLTTLSFGARSLGAATISLLCLAINGYSVLSFYGATPHDSSASVQTLKVISANIGESQRIDQRVVALIREQTPDLLLLIELTPPALERLDQVLQVYPHRYAIPRDDYFGIGLFSRFPLHEPELLELGYLDVPAISVRVETARPVRFVGVHLEWPLTPSEAAGRNTQLRSLAMHLADVQEPTILIGDFNLTRWTARLDALLAGTGLRDAAVGFGWQPTWPTFFPRLGIAIDHCLVSPHLSVHRLAAGPHVGSDHYPLIVELSL